jgi:hypothetical protein
MEKIPCSRCGTPILPSTAARNDGLCMPCATGTRAAIDAGKKHHQEQREQEQADPLRRLWCSLVDRVHDAGAGYAGLTEAERRYFAVGVLEGDVYNGGFDQYFFNSASSWFDDAVLGLGDMGATATLGLLLRARQVLFGDGPVPTDIATRRGISRAITPAQAAELEAIDALFWKDPDGLEARKQSFLVARGLLVDEPGPAP